MAQILNPQNNQNIQNNQNKKPDEKLKFLKREEINTMQKDVSRLREAEAREERNRINKFDSSASATEKNKFDSSASATEKNQSKTSEEIKKEIENKEQLEKIPVAVEIPAEIKIPEKKLEDKPKNEPKGEPEIKIEKILKEEDGIHKNIDSFLEEKRRIERDLSWLPEKKIPLKKELKQLQDEIENIQSAELGPALREEKKIEDEKKIVEEQEKEANFQDRQIIESKRWEIERKRKTIEERKWQIEEKIEERDQRIKKINFKLSEITGKEEEFNTNIQDIAKKAEGVGLQKEKINLQEQLSATNLNLEKLGTDFQNILTQKTAAEKNLNEILSSEKALEEEIFILEDKEAKATVLSEQKIIEQKRWETDNTRKKTEEEKWQQQIKNKDIEQRYNNIAAELQQQKEKKVILENKIKEIGAFLEKIGIKMPNPEINKQEPIQKAEQQVPVIPVPPPPSPFFSPKQKVPVLKQEIKTPPSGLKRILIRLGVLIILIFVVAFSVWFFVLKNKTKPNIEPSPSPSPTPIETPEAIIPQPLIPIEKIKNIEIATYSELQDIFFGNALQLEENQEQFSRILIKNTSRNQFLGIKEFFEAFEVAVPDNFYDKIDNDFTLFVYATSSETRLGFVIKINNKDGVADLMKNWEKTMEKDFNTLFSKGLKNPQAAISPIFKNAYFKKQLFRYQTFAKNDFGICYGVIGDYLIFTTSGKSMLKIIDLMPNQ